MTLNAASDDTTRRPRLFWRRAFAFLIDVILFNLPIVAIFLALAFVNPEKFGFSLMSESACVAAPPGPVVTQIETEWRLQSGEQRTITLCRTTGLGNATTYALVVDAKTSDETGTSTRSISIPTDETGALLPSKDKGSIDLIPASALQAGIVDALVTVGWYFAFISVMAYFSANGRRTPGKWLTRLQVLTTSAVPPSVRQAFWRETLKLSVVLIGEFALLLIGAYIAVSVVKTDAAPTISVTEMIAAASNPSLSGAMTALAGNPLASALAASASINFFISIVGLLWWFLPFLLWRGQTYYDRIAGCIVTRRP